MAAGLALLSDDARTRELLVVQEWVLNGVCDLSDADERQANNIWWHTSQMSMFEITQMLVERGVRAQAHHINLRILARQLALTPWRCLTVAASRFMRYGRH